jgi:hypothetical protein
MRFRPEHVLIFATFVTLIAFTPANAAEAATLSASQACLILKKRMGVHDGVPPKMWFCDVTLDVGHEHPRWWVIGLRSFRRCDYICSNLRGWFAVNRLTGEVREWEMGEDMLGGPIGKP